MVAVKVVMILIAFIAKILVATVFAQNSVGPQVIPGQNQELVLRKKTEMHLDETYRMLLQVYCSSDLEMTIL